MTIQYIATWRLVDGSESDEILDSENYVPTVNSPSPLTNWVRSQAALVDKNWVREDGAIFLGAHSETAE